MVLLTITSAAKTAIEAYNQSIDSRSHVVLNEPSLTDPTLGGPISHAQLIEIARFLRQQDGYKSDEFRLDTLIKGASIYVAPPKPKPQQTAEYTALMKRLRREEEHRAYERMINPPSSIPEPARIPTKDEEDEVTYADINRQLALIINVLVSIIACSVAIWIAARHWSVPQRLALSMTGSGVVAFAEVVIYSGYIRRVREAKEKEVAKLETKEVMETWVTEKKSGKAPSGSVRHRKGRPLGT